MAQKMEFEAGKIELTHGRAVGIVFLVAREHAIPSTPNPAASGKCQIGRMPVAFQKRVHIALIPVVLLGFKNILYDLAVTLLFVGGSFKLLNLPNVSKERQE